MRFCRDFDLDAKNAFSQAPSGTNFLLPGSASDSRTGPSTMIKMTTDFVEIASPFSVTYHCQIMVVQAPQIGTYSYDLYTKLNDENDQQFC